MYATPDNVQLLSPFSVDHSQTFLELRRKDKESKTKIGNKRIHEVYENPLRYRSRNNASKRMRVRPPSPPRTKEGANIKRFFSDSPQRDLPNATLFGAGIFLAVQIPSSNVGPGGGEGGEGWRLLALLRPAA